MWLCGCAVCGCFRSESLVARMRGLWVLPFRGDGCADARIMGVSPDEDDVMIKCVWIDIIV